MGNISIFVDKLISDNSPCTNLSLAQGIRRRYYHRKQDMQNEWNCHQVLCLLLLHSWDQTAFSIRPHPVISISARIAPHSLHVSRQVRPSSATYWHLPPGLGSESRVESLCEHYHCVWKLTSVYELANKCITKHWPVGKDGDLTY